MNYKRASNLALKFEYIKLKILGNEIARDQSKHEHKVNKHKNDLSLEKEKIIKN